VRAADRPPRRALAPCSGFIQLVIVNNVILFFQERDGPWFPVLRLLHQ
jgi:PUA domain protein